MTLAAGLGVGGGFVRNQSFQGTPQWTLHLDVGHRITPRIAVGLEYTKAQAAIELGCYVSFSPCGAEIEFKGGLASVIWTPHGRPFLSGGLGIYWLGESGPHPTTLGIHGGVETSIVSLGPGLANSFVFGLRVTVLPWAPSAPITDVTLSLSFRHWDAGSRKPPRQAEPLAEADRIVLERTTCYGTCPAYRLAIRRRGKVSFLSRNPRDEGRAASDSLPVQIFDSLTTQLEQAGFLGFPARIESDRSFCPDVASDHPTVTLTVFFRAGVRQVEDYQGCFAQNDHSVSERLAALRRLEQAVDRLAGAVRWVRPARFPP